ncbi:Arylphorin [Eumeta japonica]|uniref:Arylphorin n=1 Tax=Eumeta variegata TaxID=151549 RepID=A0A4C1SJI4_EUMVA|nr:Arylphorin [Eumeta japonica]
MLDAGKVPKGMSEIFYYLPNRLMLPKGTKGGFPFRMFVIAYPYVPLETDDKFAKEFYLDNKPLGYPFDRPVSDYFYLQPNMYFEDVVVYHEGEDKANYYNIPGYTMHDNVVPKH